jgi:prolyl 4-hydroxylase
MSRAGEALALIQSGRSSDAVALLANASAAQDLLLRGLWQVEGARMPRDLIAARDDIRRASEAGLAGAARIYGAFLATGAGGARDWAGACKLLKDWAERDPLAARQAEQIGALTLDAEGDPVAADWPRETLSASPRVELIPRFLRGAACDLLSDIASPRFKPAMIFHEGQRQFVEDPIRQSGQTGFSLVQEWPFVHAVNRRIARLSGTTPAQGEPLQVLRYTPGQHYRKHLDAVPGLANQRVLTVLIWLNDAFDGGETAFTQTGLSVRGRKGDALIFTNTDAAGRPDPMSEHEGRPVTRGVKLLASRWIRARAAGEGGFGAHEVG